MKKIFVVFIIVLVLIFSSVAGLLFTKSGNNIISSYIEKTVNDGQDKVRLKVENFDLGFDSLSFNAKVDDNSNININGKFNIFSQNVDLKYDIKIKDLSNFKKLINKKLNGSLSTSGTIIGNKELIIIKGISDIAKSDTQYILNLVDFNVKNINLDLKSARIEKLLYLLDEPIYANGVLNINAKINDTNIKNLDGTVIANIKNTKLNNLVINKEFKQNITVPIRVKSDINALLKGSEIQIKTDTLSSLASLNTKKTVINLNSNEILSDYLLNIGDLSKFESLIGKKLNGKFKTNGNVKIKDNDVRVKGSSDIAKSMTSYEVNLKSSKLDKIIFNVESLQLDSLLRILNEPSYAKASIDLKGNLKAKDFINGNISSEIKNGLLSNAVMNKAFGMKLKDKIEFSMNNKNILEKNLINSTSKILTSVGNLVLDNSVFDMKKNKFTSNYNLILPDLLKLRDIISKKMRGKVKLLGSIESEGKNFKVDGSSEIIGGKFNFNLFNNDFKASLKDAQVKDLTHMLYYPKVFDSRANLNLNYNLLSKKGKLRGDLLKGRFLPNQFSSLVNQFAKFDLTREVYENVILDTNINDKLLNSSLNMKSKHTQIDIKDSKIDMKKDLVDAKIKADIQKIKLDVKVKGNINNPKISLDTKALLKGKVGKKIDKIIDKNIKNKEVKDVLHQFKSIFGGN